MILSEKNTPSFKNFQTSAAASRQTVLPFDFIVFCADNRHYRRFHILFGAWQMPLAGDALFESGEYGSGPGDFVAGRAIPVQLGILLDLLFNFFAGKEDGGVIFVAHKSAYLRRRHLGVLSGQIHTEMSGQGHGSVFFG